MPRIQQSYQSINNLINSPISEVLDIKKAYQKDRPLIQYDRLELTIYTLLFSDIASQFLF